MNSTESKKFYITTPIYYVNDKPHIGHAYTTILADVLARFHRILGDEVFSLTGLDEHGQKVQQAAEKRGVDPQAHCDEMADRFLDLWEKLHIRYDDFIRTTEGRHIKVVQDVLQTVYDNGDIYEDEYEGWYSVAEERFITEKEVESGEFRDVRKLQEKNYFFRMGKYQQALIDHIHENPDFIQPEFRKNEVLGFLRQPLDDLCISRPKSRLNWGVELPFDERYVTYVWFDALLNYITAPGYAADEKTFNQWWPADYHLIGKDILTTHAVYWPTMLMSAGIPLPKTIFAHGWWLSGESKMSKSLGNVVNPLDLIDQFGVDPVRYYLMREMVLGQDSDFTIESFVQRYNSDLANDFGNLLSRVTRLIEKNFDGVIPEPGDDTEAGKSIRHSGTMLDAHIQSLINNMKMNDAIEEILQYIRSVNRYMEQQAPWKLVKEDKPAAARVLHTALEALRLGTVLLQPVMPNRTRQLLEVIGAADSKPVWGDLQSGTRIKDHDPLFPRFDVKKLREKQSEKSPEKTAKEHPQESEQISYEQFRQVELRTATILSAEKVEGADKLLKLQIDLGDEQRQLVAGIAQHYAIKDLPGKTIVVVANLKPAKIRGVESNGMLLAASGGNQLALLTIDDEKVKPGERVY